MQFIVRVTLVNTNGLVEINDVLAAVLYDIYRKDKIEDFQKMILLQL